MEWYRAGCMAGLNPCTGLPKFRPGGAPRADSGSASLTPVAEDARERVFAMRGALGRAYAVPFVVALTDPAHVAEAMAE